MASETPPPPPPPPPPPSGYPPPGYSGGAPGPQPNNYLVWAILSTIFCCLPAGIVSIVYAAQVGGKYSSGDYAGAVRSSEQAKRWAIISAVAGVVVGVLYVLFALVIAAN